MAHHLRGDVQEPLAITLVGHELRKFVQIALVISADPVTIDDAARDDDCGHRRLRRRLDMNELVLLAEVLGTTVIELLRPSDAVALSRLETRSANQVFDTVAGDFADMTRRFEQIHAASAGLSARPGISTSGEVIKKEA